MLLLLRTMLMLSLIVVATYADSAKRRTPDSHRAGVAPLKSGDCPDTHPIKGNFTTYSGERCIYHMPGQRIYVKTRAERCYASEMEAVQDGCRRSKV